MMLGWIVLILLIVYFFNWNSRENQVPYGYREERNAIDILKERYARGEIEREEFLARKQELEN